MKRINYFKDCEIIFLQELGLINNRNIYTDKYHLLNNKWNTFRKNNPKLNFLPRRIRRLIIAPYKRLVNYYMRFDRYIEQEFTLSKCQNKKSMNTQKKKFIDDILKIFNYDNNMKKEDIAKGEIQKFSDLIANFFIHHSGKDEFNIYSCFYCDSSYIGTFNRNRNRTFDVDHFFPKKQYPIFALSLYNFVPSCHVCNRGIKGSSNFNKLYNFSKNFKHILILSPTSKLYNFEKNVEIHIEPTYSSNQKEQYIYGENFVDNSEYYRISFDSDDIYKKACKAFKLEERYNLISIKNRALYINDLKKKYPVERIIEISNILGKGEIFYSFQEIYNSIFHTDEKFTLLGKMKKDILS